MEGQRAGASLVNFAAGQVSVMRLNPLANDALSIMQGLTRHNVPGAKKQPDGALKDSQVPFSAYLLVYEQIHNFF